MKKSIFFQFIRIMLPLLAAGMTFLFACTSPEKESPVFQDADDIIQPASYQTSISESVDDIARSRNTAITRAVSQISPAVVSISVIKRQRVVRRDPFFDFFFRGEIYRPTQSLGSGFIISPDGYILTNEHVVGDEGEITVLLTNGQEYAAERIGIDAKYDVALLRIEGKDLPHIPLGSSDDLLIGEWVIALGNPFGLSKKTAKPTVTVGVISATGLDFTREFEGRSYVDMIQTDASINTGNSGGPLINSLGHCIGINTFIYTGDQYSHGSIGIGFAIPINRVKAILPALKEVGYVQRSFSTGISVDYLNEFAARSMGLARPGFIVKKVENNSAAEKAGVTEGDVIIAINGYRVQSSNDVKWVIDQIDPDIDSVMEIILFRDGKTIKVSFELDR